MEVSEQDITWYLEAVLPELDRKFEEMVGAHAHNRQPVGAGTGSES